MTLDNGTFSHSISLIIPVHNAERTLELCLQAILAGSLKPDEIIIVDDRSTDNTPAIARQYPVRLHHTKRQSYSPAARNLGIKLAQGDILVFLDGDVVVHADTLEKIRMAFIDHPELTAVFGSYDDQPPEKNPVSQFRNLLHHYVHQQARKKAVTFWTGCGAVRAEVFDHLGLFETGQDGMKDIEFGYRMTSAGYQIELHKDILVTHLKKWTLKSMLRTDIFLRAAPWTRLLLEKAPLENDLNVSVSERLAAVFTWLALIGLPMTLLHPGFLGMTGLCALGLIWLKQDLFKFFHQHGGWGFLLISFLLYSLYLLYSSATFAVVYILHQLGMHPSRERVQDEPNETQENDT
jgi:glycosyltransferase involved in cell wall biosynthesis